MESNDESKEPDIKDRTCYYFDDIMTVRDIYSSDILLDVIRKYEKIRKYFNL